MSVICITPLLIVLEDKRRKPCKALRSRSRLVGVQQCTGGGVGCQNVWMGRGTYCGGVVLLVAIGLIM